MNDVYTWKDDLYPLVTRWFNDRLEKRTDLISLLIGKEVTDRVDVQDVGLGGFGLVPEYDGTTITELSSKRGYKTIYTPTEKAAKASISYKKAKIDMSGESKKLGSRMADSLAITQVRHFYNLFANGHSSSFLGADGKALFATDHPINSEGSGAGTYSNKLTLPFSISAISTAQTMAQRYKTYDGLDFDCDMNIVLIAPELEPKAREFFGPEAKLVPETAEHGANPHQGTKYFVIKGFTAKQWAAADALLLKDMMKMVVITEAMVIQEKASNPLITEFIGYMDYVMGWSDSRMIIGSDPA